MDIDNTVKLIDAISKLLSVLVWPSVLVFLLLFFRKELRRFFASLGEMTLKGAGFEASWRRQQAEATAALGAAAASHSVEGKNGQTATEETRAAAGMVAEVITPGLLRTAARAKVLWVDDCPDNNRYERQALEALGIRFSLATSTEEAMQRLDRDNFDVIISDMGRPPDGRAGYTLLDRLSAIGDRTPFIIYAASNKPEHVREARSHGAIGCTNNANDLFEMVLFEISGQDDREGSRYRKKRRLH